MNKEFIKNQAVPLSLTVLVMVLLIELLYFVIKFLNLTHLGQPISLNLNWDDVVVGAVVYLKTAVDFAIFMGLLMTANQGWKNRVAIEIGTALGNALGTILILVLWVIFKQLHVLLAVMILLSALVLFELAGQGLEHFEHWQNKGQLKKTLYSILNKFLSAVLKIIHPLTSRILPDISSKVDGKARPWKSLLLFSISIPFILGLDDFAGYVPLFSVVKVFGFATGTIIAHTFLNIGLFLNPSATIKLVKNSWVSFFGTLAFIGLAVLGMVEAVKILF